MQKQPFEPIEHYVHLDLGGVATVLPGGAAFWSMAPDQMMRIGQGWLVSEYCFEQDWPNWEMHPAGDEIVYVLEGEAILHLEHSEGMTALPVRAPGMVVIPAGVWHTAKVLSACRMLHVTMGAGTESRPAV